MFYVPRTLALLLAAMLLAAPAFSANHAAPGGGHRMGGPMMYGGQSPIPAEKQAAFDALLEAHHAETAPLHDALWAKHEELRALAANPNTKPETIQALVKELSDLRAQLRGKQDAFRAKVKSEIGVTLPAGMGRGYGMMGGGCGMMGGGCMRGYHGMGGDMNPM